MAINFSAPIKESLGILMYLQSREDRVMDFIRQDRLRSIKYELPQDAKGQKKGD